MVISGDFNAHDLAWSYNMSDSRGHDLIEYMQAKRLVVCNKVGDLPTYHTPGGIGFWPDVTFSSSNNRLISDWKVEDEITASDHRYISFRIGENVTRTKSKRFKTKSENILTFEKRLIQI